jgi:hypothetical protein
MPFLNGQPWPRVSVVAFVETSSNTWFTKSKTKAKAIAPAVTLPNTQTGSGIMSQPHPASVKAITRSATDDKTSQRLGWGDDQIRRRARTAYMVA